MKTIILAEEGIRQKGKPTVAGTHTIEEGETFVSLRFPNKPQTLTIPKNHIGVVHNDAENQISVIWHNCQAARRWRATVAIAQAETQSDLKGQQHDTN